MGAGGGGFFMFYVRAAERRRVHEALVGARPAPAALPLRLRRRAHHGELPPGPESMDKLHARSTSTRASTLIEQARRRQRSRPSADGLAAVRAGGGRLFILGVGGSAGHASHAVNDFRKLCGFEAYAPTDNVSELTARVNDEGWDTCFVEWLRGSRLRAGDGVLVFSRRRRQSREERQREPRARRSSSRARSARRSSASSGATAASRSRSPTRASSSRPSPPSG